MIKYVTTLTWRCGERFSRLGCTPGNLLPETLYRALWVGYFSICNTSNSAVPGFKSADCDDKVVVKHTAPQTGEHLTLIMRNWHQSPSSTLVEKEIWWHNSPDWWWQSRMIMVRTAGHYPSDPLCQASYQSRDRVGIVESEDKKESTVIILKLSNLPFPQLWIKGQRVINVWLIWMHQLALIGWASNAACTGRNAACTGQIYHLLLSWQGWGVKFFRQLSAAGRERATPRSVIAHKLDTYYRSQCLIKWRFLVEASIDDLVIKSNASYTFWCWCDGVPATVIGWLVDAGNSVRAPT